MATPLTLSVTTSIADFVASILRNSRGIGGDQEEQMFC
jgi:hypothetical protein